MFRKNKTRLPKVFIIIIIIAVLASLLGAIFLPIPAAYKQLTFWLLLIVITIVGALIVRHNGRKGM